MPDILDLQNKIFGKLKVISYIGINNNGKSIWKCSCECGIIKNIIGSNLISKQTESCGVCVKTPDLKGKKFGKFNVLHFIEYKNAISEKRIGIWKCLCNCGNYSRVSTANLINRRVTSCGHCNSIEQEAIKHLYRKYKYGAKKRNYEFLLSIEDFSILIKKSCYYCDSIPSNKQKSRRIYKEDFIFSYQGIDRKDNKIGYVSSNVVPCCIVCNRAKSSLSYQEFIEFLKRIKMKDDNWE